MTKELSNISTHTTNLMKSIDESQRLFTAVVLRPEVVDAHGDIYSHDVVKQACHDYVSFCMNTNLQHMFDLEKSDMRIVESYIAPADMSFEHGDVLKGDWVMTAKIENDDLWKACLSGDFTGFSVGCSGLVEELDDEG
tara:strand:- start:41293 stop:41706 length:414 start_codon:yes stop_codon:yes gene_type:complete